MKFVLQNTNVPIILTGDPIRLSHQLSRGSVSCRGLARNVLWVAFEHYQERFGDKPVFAVNVINDIILNNEAVFQAILEQYSASGNAALSRACNELLEREKNEAFRRNYMGLALHNLCVPPL